VLSKLPWPAFILGFLCLAASPAQAQGHTGIPEIDSLPLHDWTVENKPLSAKKALLYSLLPGGAQFYGGHPVRGGFLVGMETLLLGFGLSSYLLDLPKWNRDVGDYLDSADAVFRRGLEGFPDPTRYGELIGLARERAGLRVKQADLANSEIAWAVGLHLYGMLDGQEIVRQSHGPDTTVRKVREAFWRGLVFPGGGQLYNHRYGKFGMLWMAIGASALSAWSRQEVVEFLNDMLRIKRQEDAGGVVSSTSLNNIDEMELDRTLYRKRRNQYFWGIALIYIYSIMDGMVDAALSDFDRPERFALQPGPEPLSMAWVWRF